MRVVSSIVLAAAFAAFAACGGKSKPAPSTPPPPPASEPVVSDAEFGAHMQAGLDYINDLAASVVAAGTECPAIAAALEAVVARHADTIAMAARYENDVATKARSDEWAKAHQAELEAAAAKIGPPVGACVEDPAVQAAVEKLTPP